MGYCWIPNRNSVIARKICCYEISLHAVAAKQPSLVKLIVKVLKRVKMKLSYPIFIIVSFIETIGFLSRDNIVTM